MPASTATTSVRTFPEAKIERYRQECRCRKPAPGMIEQACRELELDPARSVMVGDRWLDVACGRAAGTRTVLVRTGHGARGGRRPTACTPMLSSTI